VPAADERVSEGELSVCASAQTHALLGPQSDVFNAENTQMLGAAIRLNLQILFPHTPLCFTSPPFYLARTLVAFFGVCPFLFSHVIFPYQRKQLRAHTRPQCQSARERKPSAERNILLSISDIACSPASLDCGCEIDISSLAVVKDHLGPARFCQTRFCNIKTRKS
jgi:hypothetical protein